MTPWMQRTLGVSGAGDGCGGSVRGTDAGDASAATVGSELGLLDAEAPAELWAAVRGVVSPHAATAMTASTASSLIACITGPHCDR
jgi:hypothetical protein